MLKISIVTTCKGRLEHIKKSLPKLLAIGFSEIIFVDYDCPEKSGDWVANNFPGVKVIRVVDKINFNLSDARNRGGEVATGDWLLFVDADILVEGGLLAWAEKHLVAGCAYLCDRSGVGISKDISGTVFVESDAYRAVKGYDAFFVGWGGEDDDFYWRLRRFGVKFKTYPAEFFGVLEHNDNLRSKFYSVPGKVYSKTLNKIYLKCKRFLLQLNGGDGWFELPPAARKNLRSSIESQIAGLEEMRRGSVFRVKFVVQEKQLQPGGGVRIEENQTIMFNIEVL